MTARRALPGRTIDLIRDGVRPDQLRESGDRAVWKALVSTAASAIQHGHDYAEWAHLIGETRSALGRQVRLKGGTKERPVRNVERTLSNAWRAAEKFVIEAPAAFSRDDALAHIALVRDWTADADSPLDDNERAVLAAACQIAERNGTTRPALPRRALVTETGIGERSVRAALARLDRRGLLVLEVPGRAGGDGSTRRRAGLYRLPTADALGTAYLYRGTRSMGPPAQVYGTPDTPTSGTPLQVYGTPPADNDTDKEPAMKVSLTLSADDPEVLAATWAALNRLNANVRVELDDDSPRPASLSVLPGGKATNKRRSA